MKQTTMFFALLGALLLAGCGNSDTTSQTTFNNGSGNQPFKPTSHLKHRSVVSNYYAGELQMMDTTQDRLTTFTFSTGSQPTYMQSSPDGTLTFVNNTGSNSISSLNNNLEAVKGTINLNGSTESFVTSVSNFIGFAAVPSYSNGTFRVPGAIVRFNPTDGSLNTQIMFPSVQYLAMDVAEKHLLAFTAVDDDAHWVDLTTIDPTTLVPVVSVLTTLPTGTLTRPIAAFFSSDSTKAYILSCGVECGGNSTTIGGKSYPATVTEIDVTTPSAATVVKQWGVNGAQRGMLDRTANKLYLVGSTGATLVDSGGNNVNDGYFTVIDLAASTAAAPIKIGNGSNRIIRNVNGIFWVGAQNCGVQSCVTRVNPATGAAPLLAISNGNATGIALSVNSGETYTIEGGSLFIYDKNANPVTSEYNTDIRGQASDVLYIN